MSRRARVFFPVLGVLLLLDQLSKAYARGLGGGKVPVLDGAVYFQLGLNPGIAFSLLTHASAVLLAIAGLGVAVGICVWALRARTFAAAGLVGLAMVASGAAGNAIDRVHMGRVTDFVVIQIASFRWPTFNVADAALVVGVLVLLVAGNKAPATAAS